MAVLQKTSMVNQADALPGNDTPVELNNQHFINGNSLLPPYPDHLEVAVFGLGCFWGAERLFWTQEGVFTTAVGYAGGYTKHPTYDQVCSGLTAHAEVVKIVFDPKIITFEQLIKLFWESHNPTQGMRQGNDLGSQYRSIIFVQNDKQDAIAKKTLDAYAKALNGAGHDEITTTIETPSEFYYAEDYHQQYLAKNPSGYCGISGTGIECTVSSSET